MMINKVTIIVIFSFELANISFSQNLSEKDKQEIKEQANSFCAAIEIFSGPRGATEKGSFSRVYELFNKDSKKVHAYDLFSENNLIGRDKNILGYLQDIESDYRNNIEVEFKDLRVMDCIVISKNESYAEVRVKKVMTFKEKRKEVEEIIFFNIGNSNEYHKINEVIFSNNFVDPVCSNNNINKSNSYTDLFNAKFNQQLMQANLSFEQKNYTNAKYIYNDLLIHNIQTQYLEKQIEKCNEFITINSYLTKANQYYLDKNYESALNLYNIISKDFSGISDTEILKKVEICKREINNSKYNKMIEYGDYYLSKGLFIKATEYYTNSLAYIPSNTYALAQIEKCRRGNPDYARNEINRAIRMAEENKKNWGTAFKIMVDYEPSGLLNAENYYFMVMMLDTKNGEVKETMGFKNRDLNNYLNIYAAKLRTTSKRENFEKGLDFLNFNLNLRNQR